MQAPNQFTSASIDSDVLRWMAQADDGEKKKGEKPRKEKWKMTINSWYGNRASGEWVREARVTDVKRTWQQHAKGQGHTKAKPVTVTVDMESSVTQFDAYRPNFQGEKETRKSVFWRGARIWID